MKKLRYLFFALGLLTISPTVYAQYEKYGPPECLSNLGIYVEYMKGGNINEAIIPWQEAFKACPPGVRQTLYIDGVKIYKYLIEKNKDNPELKKKLIDSVFLMYDLRSQYFPSYNVQTKYWKAVDANDYLTDDRQILNILEETLKAGGIQTDPGILVLTMNKMTDMFSRNLINGDEIMDIYSRINPIVENQIKSSLPKAEQAKRDIDLLFAKSGVASCENIVKMFTPQYEANPEDKDLVSRIVKLLSDGECYKEDLFLKTVETLYRLDPSYESAEYLYKLYSFREDHENAIKMLQEAINSEESSDTEDANYLVTLSSYYYQNFKNLNKAAEAAKEAISKDPSVAGRAYMILGTIWTQVTCRGDDIQQRAKWWVAVDYFTKAKNADASLAQEAQKHIDTYYQYFPLKEDAFLFGIIDGESYTVNCNGMSATTRIRTRTK